MNLDKTDLVIFCFKELLWAKALSSRLDHLDLIGADMADLACWWVLDLTTFVNHFDKVSREETELTNADDTTFITVVNVVKAVNEPFNFSEGCLGSDGDLQNLRNRQSVTFLEGPAEDDASLLDSLHLSAQGYFRSAPNRTYATA
jgi:hypothetical protein